MYACHSSFSNALEPCHNLYMNKGVKSCNGEGYKAVLFTGTEFLNCRPLNKMVILGDGRGW